MIQTLGDNVESTPPLSDQEKLLFALYCDKCNLERVLAYTLKRLPKDKKKLRKEIKLNLQDRYKFTAEDRSLFRDMENRVISVIREELLPPI